MAARTGIPRLPALCGCQVADDVVLLDTRRGRYASIANRTIEELDSAELQSFAPHAREVSHATAAWIPPLQDLSRLGGPPSSARCARFAVASAFLYASWSFLSFETLLRRATRRTAPVDSAQAVRAAAEIASLMPWAPRRGACLYRSALLLDALWMEGIKATWVFGVATWPFRAHCWVQAGAVVLDDDVENVRPYVPLLSV